MKKLITICVIAGMLLTANATVKGTIVDPYLLLHFDGVDGATSTIDSSSHAHSPISFFGNAQLDTGVTPAAGTASLMLDGDNDYLTIPDSTDWDICASASDDWTIDFSVKHDTHTGSDFYIRQYGDSSNYWYLRHIDSTTSYDGTVPEQEKR